jgi:hypothetical protein
MLPNEYWAPTYIPLGYFVSRPSPLSSDEVFIIGVKPNSPGFTIFEFHYGMELDLPVDIVEEVAVRGGKGWIVKANWEYLMHATTRIYSGSSNPDMNLYFNLDGWVVWIVGKSNLWDPEELIKIAESLEYHRS